MKILLSLFALLLTGATGMAQIGSPLYATPFVRTNLLRSADAATFRAGLGITDTNVVVYNTDELDAPAGVLGIKNTANLTMGSATINGATDGVEMAVRRKAGQTSDVFQVQTELNAKLFGVGPDGAVHFGPGSMTTNFLTYGHTNYFGLANGADKTNKEPYWVRYVDGGGDEFRYAWYDPNGKMLMMLRDKTHPNYAMYFGNPSEDTDWDAASFTLRSSEAGNTDPRFAVGFVGSNLYYPTWRVTQTNIHFGWKDQDTFDWVDRNLIGIHQYTNFWFGDASNPTYLRGLGGVNVSGGLSLSGGITNTTTDGTWKIYYDTDNYYFKFDSGSDSVNFTTLGANTLGVADKLTASGWLSYGNAAAKGWTGPELAYEIRTFNSNGFFYAVHANAAGNAWTKTNLLSSP